MFCQPSIVWPQFELLHSTQPRSNLVQTRARNYLLKMQQLHDLAREVCVFEFVALSPLPLSVSLCARSNHTHTVLMKNIS